MAPQVLALFALAALVCLPASGSAATLTPISQQRFVVLTDVPRALTWRVDAVDFGAFDASLAGGIVSQSSSFAPTQILASTPHAASTGDLGETGLPLAHFIVESYFQALFEVDESSEYLFTANVAELESVTDLAEFFRWWDLQIQLEASLVGPGGSLAAFDFDLQDDCAFQEFCEFSQPLVASGVLEPGLYTLTARSFAELDTDIICVGFGCSNPITQGSASTGLVGVDLRVIPEPGTLTLLGSGCVFVSAAVRRRLQARESARSSR